MKIKLSIILQMQTPKEEKKFTVDRSYNGMPEKWCLRVKLVLAIGKGIPKDGTVPTKNSQSIILAGVHFTGSTEQTASATRLVKIQRVRGKIQKRLIFW